MHLDFIITFMPAPTPASTTTSMLHITTVTAVRMREV